MNVYCMIMMKRAYSNFFGIILVLYKYTYSINMPYNVSNNIELLFGSEATL